MNKPIHGNSRLAIFDFDGTICRLNSYHVFLTWLLKQRNFLSLQILAGVALRKTEVLSRTALMDLALRSLKGKMRSEVEDIGRSLFENKVVHNLNSFALAEIEKKQNEGYHVVILSGAFDFMLKPFCDSFDIRHWQSSRIAYRNEVCLGYLDGEEFLGSAKKQYLEEHFFEVDIDWNQSYAYSDELVDMPLFSLVGNRIFVTNGRYHKSPLPEGIQQIIW